VLEAAPEASQRDVAFIWRKACYTSSPSAAEEVEFSISVWTPGLGPFPSSTGAGDAAHHHLYWSMRPRGEDAGRAALQEQAGIILFFLQLELPFSVSLGGGTAVAETSLTWGWEL